MRAKAREYKEEAESLRRQLAELEKKQGAPAAGMPDFGLGDFGFAPPAQKTEQRPGTPAFAFDPSQQSLI